MPINRELRTGLRYVAVGAACALLSNILLVGAVMTGAHYIVAGLLTIAPILAISFLLHCFVTFEVPPTAEAFARYSVTALPSYPLWFVSIAALSDGLGAPIWAASPIATGIVFLWNYIGTNWSLRGAGRDRQRQPSCSARR